MGVQFLDDAAGAEFGKSIRTIEAASAVEVVVAVRRRAGTYHHANAIVGCAAATAILAVALFAEDREFSYGGILLAPIVLGIVAAFVAELAPPLKRWLTPRSHLHANAVRAARATFVERGVHNTAARSGVLAYIGLLERECVLVFDSGLAAVLPDEARVRVEAAMTEAFPKGGVAVARALAELTSHAGRAMPHAATDVNELPDVVDTDEGRAP